MSEVILFDYWRSSASYRVRIALNLKGVAYTAVPTDLLDASHKKPDYVARNPQGFVPMLSIDGHDLTQSLAIIDYLDANYPDPPMVSSDPAERAKTLAQALVIAADIHPLNNLRVLKYLTRDLGLNEQTKDRWIAEWILQGFDALEAMAGDGPYLGGDEPGIADCCLVPQMYNARRFEVPLDHYPRLMEIDAACMEHEAFRRAHPDAVKPA